jgi:hypothetical protein
MIIIGSAILLAAGLLVLLWQAIAIAFSLLKIAYYLAKAIVCIAVIIVCLIGLGVQYAMRWLKPTPVEPVVMADDEAVPTIELPRTSFRRLRG